MSQTTLTESKVPTQRSQSARGRARADRRILTLHGVDAASGMPSTWHVTPLDDDVDGAYLIECAEGEIHSPHLWMQAQRRATVVGETEVIELVRSVVFGR